MNEIKAAQHFDRLTKRREQVESTLLHLDKEQKEVEQTNDWLDRASFESRVNLLDRLSHWYTNELRQIDQAINRIKQNKYGLCAACHSAIEPRRLATAPEVEFCSSCQDMRERLERI
jgi:DnaK suppressor protein